MENDKKFVTILGCGWLGKIVGKALLDNGFSVSGSYRRDEVEEELKSIGIEGFYFDFNQSLSIPDAIIDKTTHLLVFITPSSAKELSYPELLVKLISQFHKDVSVVFSSSTGVYPQSAGTYDESFEIDPTKPNRLFPAENALRNLLENRLTILRLAGLIGPERHPAYSLSGKTIENNGENPVNLIHAYDITAAIEMILKNAYFGRTYNLVSPNHPQKKAYYTAAAEHFGLKPPIYGQKTAADRLISGNEIERDTSFRYSHALDNFDDFLR